MILVPSKLVTRKFTYGYFWPVFVFGDPRGMGTEITTMVPEPEKNTPPNVQSLLLGVSRRLREGSWTSAGAPRAEEETLSRVLEQRYF